MTGREHDRMPYAVKVEFRTASSFLVAYSVNISRGGLFLETEQVVPPGASLTLSFNVPGVGPLSVPARVSWRRPPGDEDGPAGLGIEFDDLDQDVGAVIDGLIADFAGLSILVLSKSAQDRVSLQRMIRSIIATADVIAAADAHVAETLMTEEVDLVVVDTDANPEEALVTIRAAKSLHPPVPAVALAGTAKLRQRAIAAGADEVVQNPPPFHELQTLLVRALGRPARVA